jgi:hypothetical protein
MQIKKLLAAFAALTLAAAALTGCAGSSQPAAVNLVPPTANMVMEIQVGEIVNDPALIAAYNNSTKSPTNPQTVQDAINQLQDKTGINIQNFTKILMFADVSKMQNNTSNTADGTSATAATPSNSLVSQASNAYEGIIAQGSFNETTFIQNIEAKTGQKTTNADYKGLKLYTLSMTRAAAAEKNAIAFLSSSMMVFGSEQAVKDCVDVYKGNTKPLTGAVIDEFNKLGSVSIRGAFAVPAGAADTLNKDVPAASVLSAQSLTRLDMVGFSVNEGTQDVSVALSMHFPDAASAQDAQDSISGVVSIAKGMTTAAQLKTLLGNVQYSISDSWLTVSLKSSLTDLQSLSKITTTK